MQDCPRYILMGYLENLNVFEMLTDFSTKMLYAFLNSEPCYAVTFKAKIFSLIDLHIWSGMLFLNSLSDILCVHVFIKSVRLLTMPLVVSCISHLLPGFFDKLSKGEDYNSPSVHIYVSILRSGTQLLICLPYFR